VYAAEASGSAEISQQAKHANSVRQGILDELRQQSLAVPQSALDCLRHDETAPTDSDHPLCTFITEVFTERVSKPS